MWANSSMKDGIANNSDGHNKENYDMGDLSSRKLEVPTKLISEKAPFLM